MRSEPRVAPHPANVPGPGVRELEFGHWELELPGPGVLEQEPGDTGPHEKYPGPPAFLETLLRGPLAGQRSPPHPQSP